MNRSRQTMAWAVAGLLVAVTAHAARIGDLTETTVVEQVRRFFEFRDASLLYGLVGSMLLGISCGLLGSFIVVRRLALMGDALSHAVLPGVALGFLWTMTKNPVAIFVGAILAGLLGSLAISVIKQTTKLKEDTALGLVLASFFAVGICLLTMIQRLPTGQKSGLDKFLFGQAAAIGQADLVLMGVVTAVVIGAVIVCYKEFLITSFDHDFALASGFPAQVIHYALMLLLTFSIVIALQAVGVVLVSAMLITPAAAAYLLTDRLHRMLLLAAAFGMLAGAAGAFLSFLGSNLPTGPFMVLSASAVCALAFLFSPRHGVIVRWWRQRSRSARMERENTLKAIYQVLETRQEQQGRAGPVLDFATTGVSVLEIAERRREPLEEAALRCADLARHRLVSRDQETIYLTPDGLLRACEVVRNHRLWELFLTNEAHFASDHVHDDAEKIEHVLGQEIVAQLEQRLQFPRLDPHGRPIPSAHDLALVGGAPVRTEAPEGYGRRR